MSTRIDYLREAPDGLHPALVGAVWRGGPVGETEMAATLMHLADRGFVSMERIPMQVTSVVGPAKRQLMTQWHFDRTRVDELTGIDAALVALLFDRVAHDDTLTAEELSWQAREREGEYRQGLLGWIALVDSEAVRMGLLRRRAPVARPLLRLLAALAILTAGLAVVGTESWTPLAPGAVIAGVLVWLSTRSTRLTPAGKATRSSYRALHDFLHDFSDLDRVGPEHFALWRGYLVLALVLDVADEVSKRFDVARPGLVRDPRFVSLIEWVRSEPGQTTPVGALGVGTR